MCKFNPILASQLQRFRDLAKKYRRLRVAGGNRHVKRRSLEFREPFG
jgi:hypothetical protein